MTDRCLDSHCEHPDHRDSKPPGAATETLSRSEAHRKLLALGMPADLAGDCLDHEQVRYANASNYPGAWPILAAYRRHCAAHEGIVERAIRLDREATARACGPDLTPAEEAEIIASAPGQIGPGQTPIGRPPSTIAAAFEAMLAFLQMLIARKFSGPYTAAVRIGVEAAEQVDLTHWHAQQATLALRDLIQRAAEEHARGPVPPGFVEQLEKAQHDLRVKASLYEMALKDIDRLENTIAARDTRPARTEALAHGAHVRTVAHLKALYSPSLHPHRRPNATGKIVARMTSGDSYDVRHDDGTVAGYERGELIDLTAEAAAPVTDADLAEIEARTSGSGPLAEDGALLRRCAAEIRALRKGRREAARALIAEIGAAGPEDIEQAAARAIAQIREQDAEIDRWKTAVVSKAAERDVAVTENSRLKAEVERLTAKLAGIEGVAAQGDGMMVTISEQAATIERLTAELAGQTKAAIDWREAAKRHMARAEALRPGLTEEQADTIAHDIAREWRPQCGGLIRDIKAALLRAERGALAPGDRAILERLVDATAWHEGAREAREQAKRILQRTDLAAEPARTDPEAARRLAEARAERDRLDTKFRSYDGGDRPQSPPASLIRDLRAAEERVRELEAK